MDAIEEIFGAALSAAERGAEAVAPPVPGASSPAENVLGADGGTDGEEALPPPMERLAELGLEAWDRNVSERDSSGVSARLQYAFDTHTCHFTEQSILAMRSQGISEATAKKLKAPVTFAKNRALQSLMDDMMNSASEPLFIVKPTPVPDVSDRVDAQAMQGVAEDLAPVFGLLAQGGEALLPEAASALVRLSGLVGAMNRAKVLEAREKHARIRAERMQKKVWDVMVEGGWERENQKCVEDFCVFGTAFMVGPVMRVVSSKKCEEDKDGVVKYVRKNVLKPVYERLNPLDCYPSPDADEPCDGPFCVRVKYSGEELWRFCDAVGEKASVGEGWNAAAVRDILERWPKGGVKIWTHPEDAAKRRDEMKSAAVDEGNGMYEAVRCFMPVKGAELAELGIYKNRDGKAIKLNDYYHVEAIILDGKVVYCRIMDSRIPVPVSKAVCYAVPGAFWGESLADKMKLAQTMLDNIAKSMFVNLLASGPMYWVDYARLRDKNDFKVKPWGVIAFDAPPTYGAAGSQGVPMGVLQSQSIQPELVQSWNAWVNQADNDSGIPRFAEGQTGGQLGALRTSGGLSQMTDHMMRGSKAILRRYDNGIVRGTAQLTAEWVLVEDKDMTLKGDVEIRAVGLFGRLARALRDQDRFQTLQLIGNTQYFQMLLAGSPEVPLSILRAHLKEQDVDVGDLPGEEELEFVKQVAKIRQLAMAAQGEQAVQAVQQPEGAMPSGGVAERRSVA